MKDNIFIGWSGNSDIAVAVKKELESKYNYRCFIGGNADNSSSFASVGDTVIRQIKSCNQAIIIFQNRSDGAVSNNLFFELGFVLASYGQPKVHCVKRETERIVLPSDFDNSFVEAVSDDDFVGGIIKYFIDRQKLSVNTNKMYLIDNRYIIHDFLKCHYSDKGSKCSDYELAQYILFYMQAAHMFGDCEKICREIIEFKHAHQYEFSPELAVAVNLAISFLEFTDNIKMTESGDMYIDIGIYRKVVERYNELRAEVIHDDMGTFDEWADVFISEQLCYVYDLWAHNPEISEERRDQAMRRVIQWSDIAVEDIEKLQAVAPIRENNDHVGLLSLFKAYVYRNRFLAERHLKTGEELKWLNLTKNERVALKRNFEYGSIDSHIIENLEMEYYLCITEYLSYADELELDKFDVSDLLEELREYLRKSKIHKEHNKYIDSIAHAVSELSDKK